MGIDNARNVMWCKPISWTENEELKADVKSYVEKQTKLNLTALAQYLQPKLASDFQRRHFKEFKYLTVEPPLWGVLLTYGLTLVVNLIISLIIVKEAEDDFSY